MHTELCPFCTLAYLTTSVCLWSRLTPPSGVKTIYKHYPDLACGSSLPTTRLLWMDKLGYIWTSGPGSLHTICSVLHCQLHWYANANLKRGLKDLLKATDGLLLLCNWEHNHIWLQCGFSGWQESCAKGYATDTRHLSRATNITKDSSHLCFEHLSTERQYP